MFSKWLQPLLFSAHSLISSIFRSNTTPGEVALDVPSQLVDVGVRPFTAIPRLLRLDRLLAELLLEGVHFLPPFLQEFEAIRLPQLQLDPRHSLKLIVDTILKSEVLCLKVCKSLNY